MKFWAGFECASHRRGDGLRLDLIRATRHDRGALDDYRLCRSFGFETARDGIRWHRVEQHSSVYDWASWDPMIDAAQTAGIEIVWDLLHFGLPDHCHPDQPDFPDRFRDFVVAAADHYRGRTGKALNHCLVNEPSFWGWAVDHGVCRLSAPVSGQRLKDVVARSVILAARALDRDFAGGKRLWVEPLIHVAPRNNRPDVVAAAAQQTAAQFTFLDSIFGHGPVEGCIPSLGGTIGLNVYPSNQFYAPQGSTIPMGHHAFRPLSDMLIEVWGRYHRPLMIGETGAEGAGRVAWLHYVCDEVRIARAAGVPIDDICLYPIVDYPGWDDSRHCHAGLFGMADHQGQRSVYQPLHNEIERQRMLSQEPTIPIRLVSPASR